MNPNEPTTSRSRPDGTDPSSSDADPSIEAIVVRVQEAATTGDRAPVAGLNVEAGTHDIPTDPREIRAALRAGQRTWDRFPYYGKRYGERGQRFTRSDSAWIVTLAEQPPTVAERQLRWLGEVLAARGMPRWLLETHIETLHAELAAEAPEKRETYDSLLRVARILRDERHQHVDEDTGTALAAEFDRRVGPNGNAGLPETGTLLVAAVADERAGIERAVESVVEWVADPTRFSAEWVAAVTWTIEAARERAHRT